MTSVGIIKLFFQMVLVWNTVLFLPLVLFLSYFDWSRKILSRVYKSSGLPDTYKSARDLVKLTWKWFVVHRLFDAAEVSAQAIRIRLRSSQGKWKVSR
jgi:hypothetical protein